MTGPLPTGARHPRRSRNQQGAVAGLEALVFVALLLVGGGVVATGAWSAMRVQAALDAAAREYLRTYSEAPDPLTAAHRGELAARSAVRQLGLDDRRVRLTHPDLLAFGPCSTAEVRLEFDLPAVAVPFGTTWRPSTARVVRRELVDPHREMIRGPHHDPTRTPCAR